MNKIFLTKRFGFSLAEALITLLIVCIITLASVPVLTKKKRKMSDAPHGQWTCEYNEAGKHISYSQDAPTPVEGDYCEFVPPARATNFTIQAVGGGGGGNDERGGTRAYGGGSGAAVYFKFTPEYNISYSINVGKGGSKANGDDGKHSGGGGGAKRSTDYGSTAYSNVFSGDGADGANGKVIIKW